MASKLSDDQFLECQRTVANQIVSKLNAVNKPSDVAVVMEMISGRIVGSGNALTVLRNGAPRDWSFDGASIVRDIYDVMLQGLYILSDPAKRDERALLYLNYVHVERKKRIELMDASGTDFAKRLSGSSKRPEAEPAIKKQFQAVRGQFVTKKGKLRQTWYPGTLRDLAKASGLEPEYELMQRFLSGVVHSSPLTLKEGPFVRGLMLIDWHWRFAFRILGAYAAYKKVALGETEKGLVDMARMNVFNVR